MKHVIRLVFTLAACLAPGADSADDARVELKSLEGTWKAVAMEAGGEPMPPDRIPSFTFVVAADGQATGRTPQGAYRSTMAVDPAKTPKTIDHLHESGTHKGKRQYGIYTLAGDRWTVCMTAPGAAEGDRPKDFATKGTANAVFVFERQKDAGKP